MLATASKFRTGLQEMSVGKSQDTHHFMACDADKRPGLACRAGLPGGPARADAIPLPVRRLNRQPLSTIKRRNRDHRGLAGRFVHNRQRKPTGV